MGEIEDQQRHSRCLRIIVKCQFEAANILYYLSIILISVYTEASSTDDSSCRFEADVPFCQVVLNKRNSFQNPLVADANKYVKSQTHENKNDLTSQF